MEFHQTLPCQILRALHESETNQTKTIRSDHLLQVNRAPAIDKHEAQSSGLIGDGYFEVADEPDTKRDIASDEVNFMIADEPKIERAVSEIDDNDEDFAITRSVEGAWFFAARLTAVTVHC